MKLAKRARATDKTRFAFVGKPFDWSTDATCIHLLHQHLRNMGHDVSEVPAFTTAIGAKRALKRAGFDRLDQLLDSLLERIAPAMMIVGDVGLMRGEDPFDAIVIHAGVGGKVLGWHPEAPTFANLVPLEFIGAWRA